MARQYSDEELQARSDALAQVHNTADLTALIQRQKAMHEADQEFYNTLTRDAQRQLGVQPTPRTHSALPGKLMEARYAGKCVDCGAAFPAGHMIRFDGKAHCATFAECEENKAAREDAETMEQIRQAEYRNERALDKADRMSADDWYEDAREREALANEQADAEARAARTRGDGKWTLQFSDGHYRTFRIRTQAEDASFAPGKRIVQFLSGPDNEFSYTSFAFLTDHGVQLWKRYQSDSQLAADAAILNDVPAAQAAGLAYAMASGHCCRCGRTLTVPASLHLGMGPDCAAKGW